MEPLAVVGMGARGNMVSMLQLDRFVKNSEESAASGVAGALDNRA
jgi:hypothetical protein